MVLKAVLFDLDNTLILFKETIFFEKYTRKLFLSFHDLLTIQEFADKLIHATQQMVQNNGEMTNAEYFIEAFANGLRVDKHDLWQRFENFYATEFEQFRELMTPLPQAHDLIINLQQKGFKIVIASNPMFPKKVQLDRLRWAGLSDISFDLITSADNFNYCKPRLEYYHQICAIIEVLPSNCIMVGNDPFNDMIASKIGMKTYLTTDSEDLSIELSRELAIKSHLEMPPPDFKGSLKELMTVINQLTN